MYATKIIFLLALTCALAEPITKRQSLMNEFVPIGQALANCTNAKLSPQALQACVVSAENGLNTLNDLIAFSHL